MSTRSSVKVWDEVFKGLDLSYSETPKNQNQLFDLVKIDFLKEIFPHVSGNQQNNCHCEERSDEAISHDLPSGRQECAQTSCEIPLRQPADRNDNIKMLEVGCGTAFVSLYFAKRGYEVFCLDINQAIINVAQENFTKESAKGEFIVGNAEQLPFLDNQFDVVSSFGLLEHFQNPKKAISEMVRVLKPNGLFFADIVPNRLSCQTLGNIFNFIVSLTFWTIKGKPQVGWEKGLRNFRPLYFENSLSWQKYKQIMEQAGIKNIQVRGNRPFPRLTLFPRLDKIYTNIISLTMPLWKAFDRWDNFIPRFFGAGLWFWGTKVDGYLVN